MSLKILTIEFSLFHDDPFGNQDICRLYNIEAILLYLHRGFHIPLLVVGDGCIGGEK